MPALLIFFVRRYVNEPEIYRESQKDSAKRAPSFVEIFQPHLLRRTVFGASLAMGAQGAYVTLMTWLPTFLVQERGLDSNSAGGHLIVTTTGASPAIWHAPPSPTPSDDARHSIAVAWVWASCTTLGVQRARYFRSSSVCVLIGLGLGLAIGLFSASGLAFMLLFTFALPETRGRSLTESV